MDVAAATAAVLSRSLADLTLQRERARNQNQSQEGDHNVVRDHKGGAG